MPPPVTTKCSLGPIVATMSDDVFFDGTTYWLDDGFHRVDAAKQAGLATLACDVRSGTLSDAIWESAGANAQHGLRRSNKDKARSVVTALRHPRAKNMSDRDIAEHVGVSHTLVSQIAAELHESGDIERARKNNGRKVNAARIGRGSPLKQLQQWWAQAPEPERQALKVWVLTQQD
jgi:ParB-like chromosome segregation protein Spo0J